MTNLSADTMVERLHRETIAKVIYDATHVGLRNCYSWEDEWEGHQEPHRARYYKEADAIIAHLTPELERLEAEKRMLEHLLCEAREVIRKTGGGDAILNDIDVALEPSKSADV